MMKNFTGLTLIAITTLLLGSCKKKETNDNPDGPGTVQTVLPDPITANVQGNVRDENGAAAAGVTVIIGSKTATTDAQGYFRINAAALDKNRALVTASKTGYFKAYRTFGASAGTNQVIIKLVKRNLAGSVDGAAGGSASLANGSKVTLPAAGVVDATTGAAYTGAVKVFATYIDPTATDIAQTLPGSFMADDKNGGRTLLTSYGMLAVELEGAAGQKLQIKTGLNAELTTAIPASTLATAPATIALWYVDESSGVWKEQGTATKVGSTYVGNVSHFSFWNCDVANGNVVTLTLSLKGSNGLPMAYVGVRLSRQGGGFNSSTYGITDSAGIVSGMVPAGEALTMNVQGNCGASIFTQNIGPFTANTSLPAITVTASGQTTVLSGTLVNCSSAPIANGVVLVVSGNQHYAFTTTATGTFSGNILSCGAGNITVWGADSAYAVQSSPISVAFAAGTTNAGTISVCGQVTGEFFRSIVDGTTYVWDNSVNGDSAFFWGPTSTPGDRGILGGYNTVAGVFQNITLPLPSMPTAPTTLTVVNCEVELPGYMYMLNGQMSSYHNSNISITFTTVATAVGQYATGTFSGTFFQTPSSPSHTMSGSFRVRRAR